MGDGCARLPPAPANDGMLGVGSGTKALTSAEPAVMMMADPTAVARLPLKPRLAPKGPP